MIERALKFPASLSHGFSTRVGGVSQRPYDSMNLGRSWGDHPDDVARNFERLAEIGGFELCELRQVRQVHGPRVASLPERRRDLFLEGRCEADGLIASRGEGPVVLAVITADCVPLLFCTADGEHVAAVHAGWRGTVQRIAEVAVRALLERGARREELGVAIGPCIERAAFEVGEEVAVHFRPEEVMRFPDKNPHVDLVAANRRQLRELGLLEERVQRVGACTYENPERYFSYRRDRRSSGAGTGQQISFIGWSAREHNRAG